MRIISGYLGGRQIITPKGNRTHPMSERVRGALFNSLGDISGQSVIDAFAGTGALSFEAVSRGAVNTIAIDNDKNAAQAMKESVDQLEIADKCKVIRANTSSWLDNNPDVMFDLVLLDPPYDKLQLNLLVKISQRVNQTGWMVVSWPGKDSPPKFVGFALQDVKNYGDAQLLFYRRV
jgi:16S rRNA (guanine966-N2)-methyltransferase